MRFRFWLGALAFPAAGAVSAPAPAPASANAAASNAANNTWSAAVPPFVDRPENWAAALPLLVERGHYHLAVAAARDALNFQADLKSKELAYRTLIDIVDLGYPFSVRQPFVPGDLDVSGRDDFSQSYLLYKGIVNLDKKMDRWADAYFAKIDQEHSAKYLFFRGLRAYADKRLPESAELLGKALAQAKGPQSSHLARKVARTLARVRYETGDYSKSLEIYRAFLLKTDPLDPADYLEAAWSQYRLKQFPEALGSLYNLEANSASGTSSLEKYVLRGLIYREFCSAAGIDSLLKNFNQEFGPTIAGIKMGEPLASFPRLARINHPAAVEFRRYADTLAALELESREIKSLPAAVRPLVTYVYQAETAALKRAQPFYADRALEALARHLVILGESLRFLKFDVAREKYNPDRVFAEPPAAPDKVFESTDEENFRLHWLQWGDYWRDERLLYRGLVKSRCDR